MILNYTRRVSYFSRLTTGGRKTTSAVLVNLAFTTILASGSVAADGPPEFFKKSLPEHAMVKMLESYGSFQGDGAMLDIKTRELIALGVAAQIPCSYCVYAHRNNALKAGANEAELREAVAAGAFVRFWSSMFQGAEIDLDAFKAEHDKLRGSGS